ncbi:MAG TPA: hypothetical protein VLY03_11410 [Bacteroidota bacterium]|nr:hypothetical protein [Bacteroidota bacterium]
MLKLALCAIIISWVSIGIAFSQNVVSQRNGTSASIDPSTGVFRIAFVHPSWVFTGSVQGVVSNVGRDSGNDSMGSYRELKFDLVDGRRSRGGIRVYEKAPLALFTFTFIDLCDSLPPYFPAFTGIPDSLVMFTYSEREFGSPPLFGRPGDSGDHSGPVVLFDGNRNACILSPASDFMIADIVSGNSSLKCGLNRGVKQIPAGFSYQMILVADTGINRTWDAWGRALTNIHQKKRPANDADAGLKYLGYWTDNGATYYYHYHPEFGYEGTLLAVKRHDDEIHVPVRYMQLDSWWYAKGYDNPDGTTERAGKRIDELPASPWNRFGGLLTYEPPPDLFAQGIQGFHDSIGLPLVTHNRWISRESPYRTGYRISGIGAVDTNWWNMIMTSISRWGVTTYEQDWLDRIYKFSPEFSTTPGTAESFMDDMARATGSSGLTMQYCMALPRHYLQGGAEYSNLTSIRVSGDRFEKSKWKEFLYGSRMASALGIWPWCDVFMSSETPNILLATLSAGMVGIGDSIGSENLRNISMSVRSDGVIVKPDAPVVPLDISYHGDSRNDGVRVGSTFTDHGASLRTIYVFAYADSASHGDLNVSTSQLGLKGKTFRYDFLSGSGGEIDPHQPCRILTAADEWSYNVFVPISGNGIAFIGDPGKFVTCGKQRIARLDAAGSGIRAIIRLASGERTVTLCGSAPRDLAVEAIGGSVTDKKFNRSTHLFSFEIHPSEHLPYRAVNGDTVAEIPLTISIR